MYAVYFILKKLNIWVPEGWVVFVLILPHWRKQFLSSLGEKSEDYGKDRRDWTDAAQFLKCQSWGEKVTYSGSCISFY